MEIAFLEAAKGCVMEDEIQPLDMLITRSVAVKAERRKDVYPNANCKKSKTGLEITFQMEKKRGNADGWRRRRRRETSCPIVFLLHLLEIYIKKLLGSRGIKFPE